MGITTLYCYSWFSVFQLVVREPYRKCNICGPEEGFLASCYCTAIMLFADLRDFM